jgi:hypothetical protein
MNTRETRNRHKKAVSSLAAAAHDYTFRKLSQEALGSSVPVACQDYARVAVGWPGRVVPSALEIVGASIDPKLSFGKQPIE